MKATTQHYDQCVEIYKNSRTPIQDILEFASINKIDEYSFCTDCESQTPDVFDRSCLVCGSSKMV